MAKISFYSTIKAYDHPLPSGDRLISGNLRQALLYAGHEVIIPTRLSSYMKKPDSELFKARKAQLLEEAQKTIQDLSLNKPDLHITYHPYCKAPDWIGPLISKQFNIPYMTVESSKTGNPGYELHRAETIRGIKCADLNLFFSDHDAKYLVSMGVDKKKMLRFNPFLDERNFHPQTPQKNPFKGTTSPLLCSVAMLRPGKKTENFQILAKALSSLLHLPWNLVIIGDGKNREEIQSFFSAFSKERIYWAGELNSSEVLGWLQESYAFLWPGLKEPIGMVYMEAGFMGAPSVAFRSMGVPLVVTEGITGLLAEEGSVVDYREKVLKLLTDKDFYAKLKSSTREYMLKNHNLRQASDFLNTQIERLIREKT